MDQGTESTFRFVGISSLRNLSVRDYVWYDVSLFFFSYLSIHLGLGLLMIFFWWESHRTSPIIALQVFQHNVAFIFSNLAALINYASTYAIAFLLSLICSVHQRIHSRGSRTNPGCPACRADHFLTIGRVPLRQERTAGGCKCRDVPDRLRASVILISYRRNIDNLYYSDSSPDGIGLCAVLFTKYKCDNVISGIVPRHRAW
jgi:hypothetical protein